MNRRELLRWAGVSLAPAAAATGAATGPRFFDVKNFGAMADGKTLDSPAINRGIDACHAAGGGVVYLAGGSYLSGTVVLKSNVTLYLEADATLLGSTNIADYGKHDGPPERGDANQKHL